MQIRHNTSLLEQAVEHVVQRASIPVLQAQADALERTNRAVAIRRIATGAAVAIIAVLERPVEFDRRGRQTAFENFENRKPDLCWTLCHHAGTARC